MHNQPPALLGLSHLAFHVSDLANSSNFYTSFLFFKAVERPAFDFDGLWLQHPCGLEIHLIAGKSTDQTFSGSRKNHIAFKVSDFDQWVVWIQKHGLETVGPKKRPDGVDQLFIKDPDGYWVEITTI